MKLRTRADGLENARAAGRQSNGEKEVEEAREIPYFEKFHLYMPEYQLLDILAHARVKSIPEETSIKYERTRARTLAFFLFLSPSSSSLPRFLQPVVVVFSLPPLSLSLCVSRVLGREFDEFLATTSLARAAARSSPGLAGVPLSPRSPSFPRPPTLTPRIRSRLQPGRRRGSLDVRGRSRGKERRAAGSVGSRPGVATRHRAGGGCLARRHHLERLDTADTLSGHDVLRDPQQDTAED